MKEKKEYRILLLAVFVTGIILGSLMTFGSLVSNPKKVVDIYCKSVDFDESTYEIQQTTEGESYPIMYCTNKLMVGENKNDYDNMERP